MVQLCFSAVNTQKPLNLWLRPEKKERNNAYFISGDGVKDPSFIENAGKYAMEYYVSAPFDLSK